MRVTVGTIEVKIWYKERKKLCELQVKSSAMRLWNAFYELPSPESIAGKNILNAKVLSLTSIAKILGYE